VGESLIQAGSDVKVQEDRVALFSTKRGRRAYFS